MKERILLLRKALKMSQENFGKMLGITKSSVSNMESGRYNVTDSLILLICSKFNVSEKWLRTGQGEMFVEPELFSLDEFAKRSNLSDLEYNIIRAYMDLDEETRKALLAHFKNFFNSREETTATKEIDIEKEVADYRRQLELEKSMAMLSASRFESGSA